MIEANLNKYLDPGTSLQIIDPMNDELIFIEITHRFPGEKEIFFCKDPRYDNVIKMFTRDDIATPDKLYNRGIVDELL